MNEALEIERASGVRDTGKHPKTEHRIKNQSQAGKSWVDNLTCE